MSNWENLGTAVMGNTVPYNPNWTRYEQKVVTGVKELTRIRICRLPTLLLGGRIEAVTESPPGHYWIEIINDLSKMDGSEQFIESYGWYPAKSADFSNSFTTDGCLNSDNKYFRDIDKNENYDFPTAAGRAKITEKDKKYSLYPFDPHHNGRYTIPDSKKGEVNHPYLFADDSRTEEDIIKAIRTFASNYQGQWKYNFDSFLDNTCHTFLFNLLFDTNIADKYILKDPHFKQYLKSALKYSKGYTIESRPPYGAPHKIEYNQQTIEQATKVYNRMKKVKDNALRVVEILR